MVRECLKWLCMTVMQVHAGTATLLSAMLAVRACIYSWPDAQLHNVYLLS